MSEKQSFLNASGVTYLWKRILNEKYIDESEIEVIVNAIDESKLDKTSLTSISTDEIDEICDKEE